MTIHEMEYKGLNLLDEVCTVELAIDEPNNTIHIFDTQQVVEPSYHFADKQFKLSDGFFQLVAVLRQKYYFPAYKQLTDAEWLDQMTWLFYSSKQTVKRYQAQSMDVHTLPQLPSDWSLFMKYVGKLK